MQEGIVSKENSALNLDLSVDYEKNNILDNNNVINDPNRSTNIWDYKSKKMEPYY